MKIFEIRATTIIYNFLRCIENKKVFMIPSNTCAMVLLAFEKAKVPYEFIDISLENFCIDKAIVLNKLRAQSSKYSGVYFIRTYGIMSSFEHFFLEVKKLDSQYIIIDDKCMCIPTLKSNEDTVADIELFSTGYTKYVDINYGGYSFFKKNIKYKREFLKYCEKDLEKLNTKVINCIKSQSKFYYENINWLNTITPKVSFEKYLKIVENKIKKIKNHKDKINKIYEQKILTDVVYKKDEHIWRFNILVSNKKILLNSLKRENLPVTSAFASLNGLFSEGYSKNATFLFSRVLNLFNDFRINESQARSVAEIVAIHINKYEI